MFPCWTVPPVTSVAPAGKGPQPPIQLPKGSGAPWCAMVRHARQVEMHLGRDGEIGISACHGISKQMPSQCLGTSQKGALIITETEPLAGFALMPGGWSTQLSFGCFRPQNTASKLEL